MRRSFCLRNFFRAAADEFHIRGRSFCCGFPRQYARSASDPKWTFVAVPRVAYKLRSASREVAVTDRPPGFFQGTEMPTAGWWEALWPDPASVLAAVGLRSVGSLFK